MGKRGMTLKGICLTNEFTPLEKGVEYFLFPLGSAHYYVSKFDSPGSHYGAFEARHFLIKQKEQHQEQLTLF